jgi:hypothetical protein
MDKQRSAVAALPGCRGLVPSLLRDLEHVAVVAGQSNTRPPSPLLDELKTGSAALYGVPEVNVQVLMFWIAVPPPVPPVNPT